MNLINRVKGIILNPKTEWNAIQQEQTSSTDLLIKYLIPLVLIPVIASFIGFGLIGRNMPIVGHIGSVSFGIRYAILMLVNMILGVYLTAFIIDVLAPAFSAVRNYNNAFRLVVYSYTPMLVAGVLYILPALSILVFIASIYGLYILYLGLKPMMQVPEDKVTVYFIVSLLVLIAVYFILSIILSAIIIRPAFSIPGTL
ncbi:MAG TPA: Yip1 family protein [Bacteroidales bacterium]|nr:Yip1 family protein [Bacteroidales bacterium]